MSELTWSAADNRVAAIYTSRAQVMQAKSLIQDKLSIKESAITIVQPSDTVDSRALEGDSEKIGKSMLWVHLIYGFTGVIIGLLLGWLLVNFGPEFAQLNPQFTYIAMLSPGLFIGLFLSGLISLKPQHDQVNMNVTQAVESEQWALFVEVDDTSKDKDDVLSILEKTGPEKII